MTLMKAGALILLLVVVGASLAGLALGGLSMFTGSAVEQDIEAPGTEMVAQETAIPPTGASEVALEDTAASVESSAVALETVITPAQASAPAKVETATFALG